MWIRTQKKHELLNCTKIRMHERDGIFSIGEVGRIKQGFFFGNFMISHWLLGEYKSKERCLQILDEIHIRLTHLNGSNKYASVYQMPEK